MTTHPLHRRRLYAAAAGLALLAAVGVAGCSGGMKNATSGTTSNGLARSDATGATGVAPNEAAPDQGAGKAQSSVPGADAAAPPASGGNAAKVPVLPAVIQRSIIHPGAITVRVADVNQAATQAEALADAAGGYLGGDDRQIDAGQSTATLTL